MQICTRAVTHDQGALELRADDSNVETHPDGRTVGVLHSVRGGSAPPNRRLDLSSGIKPGPGFGIASDDVRFVARPLASPLLRAAHRPVHRVPVRRDLLQRARGRHGGRLEPPDHPFDFRQALLDVEELAPDAVQFLRKNLVLAALGALAHDAGGV